MVHCLAGLANVRAQARASLTADAKAHEPLYCLQACLREEETCILGPAPRLVPHGRLTPPRQRGYLPRRESCSRFVRISSRKPSGFTGLFHGGAMSGESKVAYVPPMSRSLSEHYGRRRSDHRFSLAVHGAFGVRVRGRSLLPAGGSIQRNRPKHFGPHATSVGEKSRDPSVARRTVFQLTGEPHLSRTSHDAFVLPRNGVHAGNGYNHVCATETSPFSPLDTAGRIQ